MKGIKKTIAVILAILLVISAIPADNALAATKTSLNVSSRTIYVDGSAVKGGKYKDGYYVLKLKNKSSKYSCEWKTDKPDVVKISKVSKGKVKVIALKPGKAVVTANYIDKKTNTRRELTCTVTVMKNVSSINITGYGSTPMKMGDTLQLSAELFDKSGKAVKEGVDVTDYVKWLSSDDSIVYVSDDGTLTAIDSGTAEITCYTVQSASGTYSKLKKATAKKTISVDVDAMGLESVSVKSLNSIEAKFGMDFSEDLTKNNFSITQSNGTALNISDMKVGADNKSVILTTDKEFLDGAQYTLVLKDTEATVGLLKSFSLTKGNPVKLEIGSELSGNKVIAGKEAELKFRLYNAQGIDITPLDEKSDEYTRYKSMITYSITDKGSWYVNLGKLYINDVNAQVKVSAKMSGPVVVNGTVNQIDLAAEGVFYSVSEASLIRFDPAKDAVITDTTLAGDKLNFNGAELSLPYGGESTYKLVVRVNDGEGNYLYSNDESSSGKRRITFISQTNTASVVEENGKITALKKGTDTVEVRFDGEKVGTVTLTMSEPRVAKTMKVTVDGVETNIAYASDAAGVSGVKVNIEVFDQYGKQIAIKKSSSTSNVTNNLTAAIALPTSDKNPSFLGYANADGTGYVQFDTAGLGSAGGKQYVYNLKYVDTVLGNLEAQLILIVRTPQASLPSTYSVAAEGDMDITLSGQGLLDFPSVDVKLYELKNGIKYGLKTPVYNLESAAPANGFFYTLCKEGTNTPINITGCTNNDKIYTAYVDNTGKLAKLDAGSYILTVYQKINNAAMFVSDTKFTLIDGNGDLKCEKKNNNGQTTKVIPANSADDTALLRSVFAECFKVTKGKTEIPASSITFSGTLSGEGWVFFRSIIITDSVVIKGKAYTFEHKIDLDEMIKSK